MTRTEAQLTKDIHKAISDGDLDRTAFLLDEWSTLARPDFDHWLPLACEYGSVPIICLLLSHGARVCQDAVRAAQACEPYTLEIFQAFLDSGWDINESLGRTGDLLMLSVYWPPAVLKWALAHGADPNFGLNWIIFRTALEMSVLRNASEHVEALIDAGAHINNTNALKVAACHGRIEMIELLLEKGADINEIPRPDYYYDTDTDPGLGTALHEAAEHDQLAAVKLLIEKGADPTLRNTSGETALELAQRHGHSAIVEVLKGRLGINT